MTAQDLITPVLMVKKADRNQKKETLNLILSSKDLMVVTSQANNLKYLNLAIQCQNPRFAVGSACP